MDIDENDEIPCDEESALDSVPETVPERNSEINHNSDDEEDDVVDSDPWRLKSNDSFRCALERACGRPISIARDDCQVDEDYLLAQIAATSSTPALPPTPEQRALLLFTPAQHQRVVVNAYAGSGKTLACKMLATRFAPPWRPLYIVFNKEAAVHARRTMPPHVGCHTTHAFALAFLCDHIKATTNVGKSSSDNSSTDNSGRSTMPEMTAAPDADDASVAATLAAFWNDPTASDILMHHVPASCNIPNDDVLEQETSSGSDQATSVLEPTTVLSNARKVWRCMMRRTECDACDGRVPRWTFDAVLKFMALHRDASHRWLEERFDCVLVDEAQDTQQVLIGWYRELRRLPVYFVGDMHQAIYGFTGCRNAMEQFVRLSDTRVFHLTQSFRFGQNLAQLATLLLRRAGALTSASTATSKATTHPSSAAVVGVRGRDDMHCTILAPDSDEFQLQTYCNQGDRHFPITYVCRSNAVALQCAIKAVYRSRSNTNDGLNSSDANVATTIGARLHILGSLHDQVVCAAQLVKSRFGYILPGGTLDLLPLVDSEKTLVEKGSNNGNDGDRGNCESLLHAWRTLEKLIAAARRGGQSISDQNKRELDAMRIIKKYGSETVRRVASAMVDSECEADIIVGTAHSTKGLEFDLVVLSNDFYPLSIVWRFFGAIGGERVVPLTRAEQKHFLREAEWNEPSADARKIARQWISSRDEPCDVETRGATGASTNHSLSPIQKLYEEIHLYYVAMTRARQALILNHSLHSFFGHRFVEPMPGD